MMLSYCQGTLEMSPVLCVCAHLDSFSNIYNFTTINLHTLLKFSVQLFRTEKCVNM